MTRVRFRDVGRMKRTWVASLPDTESDTLVEEIRRSGALASRTIDVAGQAIVVGGFRVVGSWEIAKERAGAA